MSSQTVVHLSDFEGQIASKFALFRLLYAIFPDELACIVTRYAGIQSLQGRDQRPQVVPPCH